MPRPYPKSNVWEWDPSTGILLKCSRQFLHETSVEYSFPKHRANYVNGNAFSKFCSLYIPWRLLKDDKGASSGEERACSWT